MERPKIDAIRYWLVLSLVPAFGLWDRLEFGRLLILTLSAAAGILAITARRRSDENIKSAYQYLRRLVVGLQRRFSALHSTQSGPERQGQLPGTRLSVALEWVYGEKHAKRIFNQAIADMQQEWQEARDGGAHRLRLAFIRCQGYFAVAKASGLLWVLSLAYKIYRAFTS